MTKTAPPAVILAAGESSRFWPLSTHGHKALHRLHGKAIIEHTLESLVAAGVRDIIVVQSPIARAAHFPHRTIADQLGDGRRYDAQIRYVDMARPTGQGDALLLCREMLKSDFLLINPENINAGLVTRELLSNQTNESECVVVGKEQEETWLFGVFELEGDRVKNIVEKPAAGHEPSRICNTGIGLFNQAYLQAVANQPRDLLSNLKAIETLGREQQVRAHITTHEFFPLKYPWHLFAMAEYLQDEDQPYLGENVQLGEGAQVDASCTIENDCVIAPGVALTRCLVAAGSNINSSLSSTIVGADVTIESEVTVEDSLLEAGHIFVDVKGHAINTNLEQLGTVIGQGSVLRQGATIGAGVLIGAESEVGSGRPVSTNVGDRVIGGV